MDTQCGFKLFSAEAAEALFPRLTISGFAFDVELLVMARRAGFDMRETGIVWHGRADSRVAVSRGRRRVRRRAACALECVDGTLRP